MIHLSSQDRSSAWRKLEDQRWHQDQQVLDWMAAPGIRHYVNSFFAEDKSWVDYACRVVLRPLQILCEAQEARGIRLLSIGCGNGSVDAACLEQGWPIDSFHLAEYDDHLLKVAASRLRTQGLAGSVVSHRFDFGSLAQLNLGSFDAIFFCHSLHHCADIEGLIHFLRRSLLPHGVVFGADYFGGARLQPDFEVLPLLNRLYSLLPETLKMNLASGLYEEQYAPPAFEAVIGHDPSEAPRSGDLRSLFLGQFRDLSTMPMGGTLLRPLLANRAGHFVSDDENIQSLLRLLCLFESELIAHGKINSDDLFFHGRF